MEHLALSSPLNTVIQSSVLQSYCVSFRFGEMLQGPNWQVMCHLLSSYVEQLLWTLKVTLSDGLIIIISFLRYLSRKKTADRGKDRDILMALKLMDWYNLIWAIKAVKKAKAGLASWPLRFSCLDRCQHYPHWIALCVSKSCLYFLVPAESSTFVLWQQYLVLNESQKGWINLLLPLMLQVSKSQKSDPAGGTWQGLGKDISAQNRQECSQLLKRNGISFVSQWLHWVTVSPKGGKPASHTLVLDSLLCEHARPGMLSLFWRGSVSCSIQEATCYYAGTTTSPLNAVRNW